MRVKLIGVKQAYNQTRKALATMPVLLLAQSNFDPNANEVRGDVATIKGFERLFANFVTVILELAGIILFIMFLIAGFKYMTSQGDPKALEAAKGTLSHAITGLIILVLAFVFLAIIQAITGAQITNFKVFQP